jgi:hypothetical protein
MKVSSTTYKASIGILFCIFYLCSCQSPQKQVNYPQETENGIITLTADYPIEKDTLTLSEIADTVFYVKLQQQGISNNARIEYLDSLILVYDFFNLYTFNHYGKLLYKIEARGGSMDFLPDKSYFYLYTFMDECIRKYDLKGNILQTIHLKEKVDGYRYSFLCLNDSLFVMSQNNEGNNPNELFFINGKGSIIERKANINQFQASEKSYFNNMDWRRSLFRGQNGCYYHRDYSDTLWKVHDDMTLQALLVENKIKKVPLEQRTEYSGKPMSDYITTTLAEKLNVVRYYETSLYYIAEYKAGGHSRGLSNYLFYDKKTTKLYQVTNKFDYENKHALFHFGIFNDYDGGLAFAPSAQSGDYLIMVNASDQQGDRHKTLPKTLYQEGRIIPELVNKKPVSRQRQMRSDVYHDERHRDQLNEFFKDFNEKEHTMLMFVKLKK